jgi:hypothetical protein
LVERWACAPPLHREADPEELLFERSSTREGVIRESGVCGPHARRRRRDTDACYADDGGGKEEESDAAIGPTSEYRKRHGDDRHPDLACRHQHHDRLRDALDPTDSRELAERDAAKEIRLSIEPQRQRAERPIRCELGKVDRAEERRHVRALWSSERGACAIHSSLEAMAEALDGFAGALSHQIDQPLRIRHAHSISDKVWRMKNALSLLLLLLTITLAGCGPKWVVVKQASPNPMTASSKFKIEKAVLDPNFHVGDKTEKEWMGPKEAETQQKWEGDKVAMSEKFTDGFMGEKESLLVANAAGAGIFAVRARYVQYDPGYYVGVSSAPTSLDADVEFLDANGAIVDVIRIHVKQGGFSAGEGARRCASEIGAISAKYLKQRVGN